MFWHSPSTIKPATLGASRSIGVTSRAGTIATARPTAMTQPRTDHGPIMRLDRDDARVATAHEQAAARPPRIATIDSSLVAKIEPIGRAVRLSAMIRIHAGGGRP